MNYLIWLVAFLHVYFMILEMLYWTKPYGLKVFRQTLEQARASRVLAANQGLYNGFLAVGLIWSVAHPNPDFATELKIFFLLCVIVAGIFGAITVNRRIFFFQALPAIIALIVVLNPHLLP